MHRSRLIAVGIDVPAEAQAATADFWAGALGRRAKPDEDGTYLSLGPDRLKSYASSSWARRASNK